MHIIKLASEVGPRTNGTTSISYEVTSCAKLKCIVSCLNFVFDDNFVDRKYLMIGLKQAVNTI